jgi:uncharacterized protein (DUF2267 family)
MHPAACHEDVADRLEVGSVQHDEFIGQVQSRGKLDSRGQAERVTRSVLETIGDRIPDGLADNLAAQLPHEIGEHLRRTEQPDKQGTGEHFDIDAFVDRVESKSGLDRPQAVYATRVVCEVMDQATQGAVMTKVKEALPPEIRPILSAGSGGQMRI